MMGRDTWPRSPSSRPTPGTKPTVETPPPHPHKPAAGLSQLSCLLPKPGWWGRLWGCRDSPQDHDISADPLPGASWRKPPPPPPLSCWIVSFPIPKPLGPFPKLVSGCPGELLWGLLLHLRIKKNRGGGVLSLTAQPFAPPRKQDPLGLFPGVAAPGIAALNTPPPQWLIPKCMLWSLCQGHGRRRGGGREMVRGEERATLRRLPAGQAREKGRKVRRGPQLPGGD